METKLNLATSTSCQKEPLNLNNKGKKAKCQIWKENLTFGHRSHSPKNKATVAALGEQLLAFWAAKTSMFFKHHHYNKFRTTREKAERAIQRQVTPVGSVGSVGFGRFGSTALSRASRELDAHRLGQTQLVPEAQFQTSAICLSDQ